ncbi:related to MPP10-component of the U3 small nucleolar ribonucleoprotein [Sporisorium reilianum SRZ2]|uniref:Related to MPP10-component of the U3 small nucleolar ribonucleoprotein n=1 Tax=Sporisorium reilianum (strain SRZ2) TaxID=999809 RepID=E7A1T5_SPORE|nr:related to MPP10-component of the U3 small nucleolar ribonucleoprotein [Sporisorium reilianum SRZ2]
MPPSPRKGSLPSPADNHAQIDLEEAFEVLLPNLDKTQQLAELVATEPERLANADAPLSALSVHALKQLFDHSIHTEELAVPAIRDFIGTVTPKTDALDQRASRSGGKRKRGSNAAAPPPQFEGTPLDELITDGMDARQLWEQIDLKAAKMSNIVERYFAQGLLREEQEEEEEEEEQQQANNRAGPSRSRSRSTHDDDDDDDSEEEEEEDDNDISGDYGEEDEDDDDDVDPEEERVRLSQLSDADLRALGIDPAYRDELLAEIADQGDDDDEDSDDEGSPYAGASDVSDGDPTEVFYEPLKTEAEQLQRKEEQEMGMLPRLRSQVGHDDDDDEDDDDMSEDEAMDQDEESSDDDEDSTAKSSGKNSAGIPTSLLQDLDRPGKASQRPAKRHPTLDDDFFSIDDLNRQLDEQDAQEDADPVDDNDDDDIADQIDYFKPLDGADGLDDEEDDDQEQGADAADAHYADFFLPPSKAAKFNKKFGKRKVSARFANEDAAADQLDQDKDDSDDEDDEPSPSKAKARAYEEPDRKRRIRFNTTIEYRRIKPRKKSADELTPEMLRMIGASDDDVDAARRFDEDMDEDDDDDDDDEDDEDDDMDMDEVESETSSLGRQGSDDEGEEQYSDEDEEDAEGGADEEQESADDDEADDGVDTARRVAGDLFADSDDEADAKDKLSTHEKRVAALKEQIAQLEDENVAKKDWTLMGEAGSRARPQDSLLEQDLEFERAAKVTPQVTEEMTESIEDLIKRRILERNFDDVIRRREMEALPFLPSRLLELSDSKSAKSLAELYEEEYQAARGADGEEGAPVAEADAKLAKEHDEITQLYDDIFNKLDALSNAHFTPKAPKATIQTLTNAPSVSIETALPATASSSTMLAPEEVYERSRHATAMDGAKSEMTPDEKQRLHNQLRHEKRQRNDKIQDTRKALEQSGLVRAKRVNEKEEKQQALKKLVGNRGVSVIGKEANAAGAGTGKNAKGKGKAKAISGTANGSAKPATGNQFKL